MGIMMVNDAKELEEVNRKTRNKMSVIKEGLEVSEVLVQEGVHTIESIHNNVAEPVVYMIDRYVVGGFYRAHETKAVNENLNSPGMIFTPMPHANHPMLHIPNLENGEPEDLSSINRFYMYGVIARLALLASAIELEETDPELLSELAKED
jgi:glutamate--cysteine ligase